MIAVDFAAGALLVGEQGKGSAFDPFGALDWGDGEAKRGAEAGEENEGQTHGWRWVTMIMIMLVGQCIKFTVTKETRADVITDEYERSIFMAEFDGQIVK